MPAPTATEHSYPRFSEMEMERRRRALDAAMAARDVEHVVVYGADRAGSAVGWLTRWPVTREAIVVHTAGERDVLLINFYNHVPNAARVASEADVRWAGEAPVGAVIAELRRRGASRGRVGMIGRFDHRAYAALTSVAPVVDMNGDYTRLRLVKSAEEIEWIRVAADMTDRAVRALHAGARPGVSELELADVIERTYVAEGGVTHIHYLGVTAMAHPELCVPAQYPTGRRLAAGDVLMCEISPSYWEYAGQLLRTFAIAADPSPLYRELHAVADAAFESITGRLRAGATAIDLVEASRGIEDSGYTIRDDLVHGFVGGYLPPVLGVPHRARSGVPEFTFESGMTVVVQPNIVTRDEHAGVQTGELMLVTDEGAEPLHSYPRGFLTAPGTAAG